jgi:hypothetical protein
LIRSLLASLSCQYTAYCRRSDLIGSGNVLRPRRQDVSKMVQTTKRNPFRHTTCDRIGRDGWRVRGRVDQSGLSWRAIPKRGRPVSGCESIVLRNTYHEQSIVILQPVDFVEEERSVVIRDQRIDVLEDDQARRFSSSPLKDLLDACAYQERPRQSACPRIERFRVVLPYSSPAYAGDSTLSATSLSLTPRSRRKLTMKAPDVEYPLGLFPHPFPVGHVPHHRLDADRLSVSRRSEEDHTPFPSDVEILVDPFGGEEGAVFVPNRGLEGCWEDDVFPVGL